MNPIAAPKKRIVTMVIGAMSNKSFAGITSHLPLIYDRRL
jgi:hypothetical protein